MAHIPAERVRAALRSALGSRVILWPLGSRVSPDEVPLGAGAPDTESLRGSLLDNTDDLYVILDAQPWSAHAGWFKVEIHAPTGMYRAILWGAPAPGGEIQLRLSGTIRLETQRSDARYAYSLPLQFKLSGARETHQGSCHDLSLGGLTLLTETPLENGLILHAEFPAKPFNRMGPFTLQVQHVKHADGKWNAGCAFRTLTRDQREALANVLAWGLRIPPSSSSGSRSKTL